MPSHLLQPITLLALVAPSWDSCVWQVVGVLCVHDVMPRLVQWPLMEEETAIEMDTNT